MDAFLRRVVAQRQAEHEALMTQHKPHSETLESADGRCPCGTRLWMKRRHLGLCGVCVKQATRRAT